MRHLSAEHTAGLIVAAVCLVVSAFLFSYAVQGLSYALSGIGGVVIGLLGWGALRVVTGDLRR